MNANHELVLTTSLATSDKNSAYLSNTLANITKQMPIIVFTVNKDGLITDISGRGLSTVNLKANALIGQTLFQWNSVFAPITSAINQCLAGENVTTNLLINGITLKVWLLAIEEHGKIVGVSGACIDMTQQQEAEAALEEVQRHYSLLAEYATDVITKYNPMGICNYASPSIKRILGYRPHEIIGESLFELLHPSEIKHKQRLFSKLINHSDSETFCFRVRRRDGCYIWLETKSQTIIDPFTKKAHEIIAVSRDITERKTAEERLLYLANYDSLTGLPNRALFRDRLRRAIARAQRQKNQIALLFIDLDRFKNINDSLGHHAGDQLLREVAKRLKKEARNNDTIARLGGDEFTIILEKINSRKDAIQVANKVLSLLEPPFQLDGHEVVISSSIGITIFPDDAQDMHTLLKNADTAMYRCKEKGRNNHQFYTPDMIDKAYEYLVLETDLRHALCRNEFVLHYQPQMDLHTQRVIGLEALLRWNHPERGLLYPDEFISFAEEMGLIIPIGEWVLQQACLQARHLIDEGLPPVRIAVNLSMRQFKQRNFVELVADTLKNTHLPAHLLELEITESFLAHNVEQATSVLCELNELGVQLSVDDFGTGYSSLSYLKQFPINTLKIDQSFVRNIAKDPEGAALTEAIIGLGKSLHLHVIAEGVETDEQVFFLRGHGCDRVQGFLFSRPLASEAVIPWLKYNHANYALYEQHSFWPEAVPT